MKDKAQYSPTESSAEQINAQPPTNFTGLRKGEIKKSAVGIASIISTFRHVWGEAGIIRGSKALLKINQKGGFDCMSCAWPDEDEHRHIAAFCENGAKAVADETTTKRLEPEFFAQHSLAELSQMSDYELNGLGRITHPMILREGSSHYQSIGWEEAFDLLGKELNSLASPDEAIFYTSGKVSNEAAFLYQLFVRQFGTNNLPDCSNMCHESSGEALLPTLGLGKGSVTLQDFNLADVIVIMGQNPGTNHPRMLNSLQTAKRRGATIISVNPLPETGLMRYQNPQEVLSMLGKGTELTDLFLPVKIGGDLALLKGIIREMLQIEAQQPGQVVDRPFVDQYAEGFDAFLAATDLISWEMIVQESGISREQIREVAQVLAQSSHIIVCWAMGLTQHKNGVATIQEIVNLLLMRGSIGKPGAGTCPVRGHSNVQGDRTMGIYERMPAGFMTKLGQEFNFVPPVKHGWDVVESIKQMHQGKGKVFFGLGGNFLSATPDTEFTAAALRNCKLTAHVSTKLNRGHLVAGKQALILPCLGRTEKDVQQSGEQFVTVENSMGVVSSSRGFLQPASADLLSEPAIVACLALATLGEKTTVDWQGLAENYDRIRDHIERVIPGFEQYNERIRKPKSFYLPNGPRERRFTTPSGKAQFTVNQLITHPIKPNEYVMMTMRSHDQYNTVIYGLDDRYRGIYNERRVVLLNPEDIKDAGLNEGQLVDLLGHFQEETRVASGFIVVPYPIPRRCAATYFPETNVLVPINSVAYKSNTPTSKFIVITIEPKI
jgi:molybdopterin-dependent oxidoreductase alpha subunit